MKKLMKRIPIVGIMAILCVFLICLMFFLIGVRINAKAQGELIGSNAGSTAGKVMGSIEGLKDAELAYSEGKREGLSAKDTSTQVANKIQEVGKLEVLVASVKLNNMHSIADDYSALYLLRGDAVFTVDLSNAEIEEVEGALYIKLKQPSVELIINESKVEKIAEWQKHYFSGNAQDGFEAYLKTMATITEASKDSISNYDALIDSARESAKKQVTQLANAVGLYKRDVFISFEEEAE